MGIRRALLFASALALASCRWQLDGPPMVVEMPEVGAQVDVSGWHLQTEARLSRNSKTEAGSKPSSTRFAKDTGWSSDMRFQAHKVPFPNVTIRRVAPINEHYKETKTLEACAKSESEKQSSTAITSWKLISPPEKKKIGGVDVLELTNEVTVTGIDTALRTRWVFLAKDAYCYGIGAQTQAAFWEKEQYLLNPVFDSIKPL